MTATHVPVLAGELIELLDPQPGQTAVDCTFGGGGHARLVAERLGPDGHADRDRPRPGRRGALRRARRRGAVPHALHPRRLRRRRSSSCSTRASRADLVYMDLGMSSMQVDTCERGFSYAYDAPLDMRMDPDAGADRARDRQHVGRAPARARCCASTARSASPARSPARSSAPRPRAARDDARARRGRSAGADPRARALRAAAIPPSAPSRRSGSRSTTSSPSSTRRSRARGSSCAPSGRFAGISFHSLEDRRVKRFLAARAQGCICPPDLPVCACGRDAGGRAAHPPLGRADARRGRRQPPRQVRPDARRTEARGHRRMTPRRRHADAARTARPTRRRAGAAPAAPRLRPGARRPGAGRRRRVPRGGAVAGHAAARAAPRPERRPHRRRAVPRPPAARPRRGSGSSRSASWASSSSRSRCSG